MKAVFSAVVAVALFMVAFVLLMLAPLIMMVLVGGSMWGAERWNKRGTEPAVIGPARVRPLPRAAGSSRETDQEVPAFGFGSLAGEDL